MCVYKLVVTTDMLSVKIIFYFLFISPNSTYACLGIYASLGTDVTDF